MSGRTPSFIVVGLVIIMFLLGFFYMSCSSKNTELRLSAEIYEDRIRSLTLKNGDAEKKIDSLMTRKRELDEEKLTIQRQMEKKDSEINDLNTKLNEKIAELQTLKTDKKVLDEQLKEFKTVSETVGAKNSLIEKLQQQIDEEKQSGVNEQLRLKDEIAGLKNRLSQNVVQPVATNGSTDTLLVANERFAPKFFNNQTTKSIASFFRNPRDEPTNNSREIRPKIVPVGIDLTQNVLNVLSENKSQVNPLVGQNDSHVVNPNPVESAQAAPQFARTVPIDSNRQNNLSLNKPIADDLDDDEVEEDQEIVPVEKNPVEIPAAKRLAVEPEPVDGENANRFGQVDRQRFRSRAGETERINADRQRSGRQRKGFRRNRLANNEENPVAEEAQQRQHVL